MEHELLNVQKAVKLLGMSPKTIRKWVRLRKLKGFKVGSRGDWRFTKEDVLNMIQKEKNNTTKKGGEKYATR